MEARDTIFQRLKPHCVALSEAALALNGPRASLKAVTTHLESLKDLLALLTDEAEALDAKLADYVFFPVANALRNSQRLPVRDLELCVQCVAILISDGWKQHMQPQLAAQVVILCTLLAEKKPKGLSFTETTDELQASAFRCLRRVFLVFPHATNCRETLTSAERFPQLGQTVTVLLDGVENGVSTDSQIAAVTALEAFVDGVVDAEIHAAFLPGIVSKLAVVLTPQTKRRRHHKVLITCLHVFNSLLLSTMCDDTSSLESEASIELSSSGEEKTSRSVIDKTWRDKASEQLLRALSNVMRLRHHSRDDVKASLADLFLTVLSNCANSLANCSRMAWETLLTLNMLEEQSTLDSRLRDVIQNRLPAVSALEEVLYDWLRSVTILMQGSDDQAKVSRLHQIDKAYSLLQQTGFDKGAMGRLLSEAMRDSIVVTINLPGSREQPRSGLSSLKVFDIATASESAKCDEFTTLPLAMYRGQEEILNAIGKFVQSVGNMLNFAGELSADLRTSRGDVQLANFWLLLTTLQSAQKSANNLDRYLDFGNESHSPYHDLLEDVYAFSLSVLNETSQEKMDPRQQSLALRSLALRAQEAGKEFRYELIDALYPVLHTLATPDERLHQDSITVLNIFTSACEYTSVKDLIVENVDYLTNAVALKLNAFDISPQAPQVLLMMIRLAGPSLLPYLQDVIESIFAALEDYHGYPILVELLFKVLTAMAEEGTRSPQLRITHDQNERMLAEKEVWKPTSVTWLAALLKEHLIEEQEVTRERMSGGEQKHPKRPWKDDRQSIEEDYKDDGETNANSSEQQIEDGDDLPPAPKTYSLLLKIAEQTQYFLSSASPSLRTSLLGLIRTVAPAIANHENSFLPLINSLWPEIVARLDDEEPYITSTALDIIRILSQHAGDFMSTRITQLWPRLVEIHRTTARDILNMKRGSTSSVRADMKRKDINSTKDLVPLKQAVQMMHSRPADYVDASSRQLWSALVSLFTTLVKHVRISPEMLDDAFEILGPALEQPDVRAALENANADALWLAEVGGSIISLPEAPSTMHNVFWSSVVVTT